jgi:hypothetical protein
MSTPITQQGRAVGINPTFWRGTEQVAADAMRGGAGRRVLSGKITLADRGSDLRYSSLNRPSLLV